MKNQNPNPLEMDTIENQDSPQLPEKPFNMTLAVAKVLLAGVAVFAIFFTAKAAFSDTVLENLEKSYLSALNIHEKHRAMVIKAVETERAGADYLCNTYKALKAYKESKNIPLKNDSNPCTQFHAPQEGF